jgi:predicted amidohydrolase
MDNLRVAVRVACCQLAPSVEDPGGSAARARQAIAGAVDAGAQLIVLPELANSGYVFRSIDEARAAAAPADGELLRGWAREAARGDGVVAAGFCELAGDGSLFNSSALLDGGEVRAVYRKLHLWGQESRWFEPGSEPAPVVDTRVGRIGLGVCYDIEFPELTRGLALQGAELLTLPANWPYQPPPPGGPPILHSLAAITAYHNKVFVAVCDRCGVERGIEFQGGSVIAAPAGGLLAGPVPYRGAATLFADCELTDARDKRTSEHNDAFADRRPEHYSARLRMR